MCIFRQKLYYTYVSYLLMSTSTALIQSYKFSPVLNSLPIVSKIQPSKLLCFFFLNDPAPTEIYPLPLPDPLPIFELGSVGSLRDPAQHGSRRAEQIIGARRVRMRRDGRVQRHGGIALAPAQIQFRQARHRLHGVGISSEKLFVGRRGLVVPLLAVVHAGP